MPSAKLSKMQKTGSLPLSEQLGEILMLATRDFQRRLDVDLATRGIRGIGSRHRSVFLYLGHQGPSRAANLAQAAGIRPQSMMKAIHELEEMGLVSRETDPSDSRAKLIHFTAAGQELISELSISTRRVWQDYAQNLGEPALQQAIGSLLQLLRQTPANT
jgi:DNA-binding MarR family transcriptional regulator